MLTALGSITDQKANPTEKTMQKVKQLLDYAASHPDAVLTYQAIEMVLESHSYTLYIYKKKTKADQVDIYLCKKTALPPNNGAVFTISKIIKAVMSSSAEAELGSLFINCKESIQARQDLE